MSKETLYIEIFQPYAQYRNPFTFYYAQSYPLPPKSTIVGMLQNAVGDWYGHRHGLEKWWNNLKISVHGGFESFFWNYQQLIKDYPYLIKISNIISLWNQGKPLYNDGVKSQRTPVYQQELFNGHLFIFLKGDVGLLQNVKESLEKPKKILYLGRSEDIIFIRDVRFVSPQIKAENVDGDVRLSYPTYILKELHINGGERLQFPIRNQKYPVYSIPTKIIFKNNGTPVKHKVEITQKTERIPEFKTVIYTGTDYTIILGDKLSGIEIYRINGKRFLIIDEFGWL